MLAGQALCTACFNCLSGPLRRNCCTQAVVKAYNKYMGGVDKSDQYLSYHSILRKTVRYWKTPFYHLVDLCVVNAFILYNWITHEAGGKVISENDFRDALVCQIIYYYGREREKVSCGRPCKSDCRVKHGSVLFPLEQKARCQYCRMHSIVNWTQRKCPDCPNTPALCQNNR